MKEIFKYLKELLYLVGDDKRKIPIIFMVVCAGSVLDLIGIALIAPYIALALNQEITYKGVFLSIVRFMEPYNVVYSFGIIIILIFSLKMVIGVFISHKIVQFSQKQLVSLRLRLMQNYQSQKYNTHLKRNSSEYTHSIKILSPIFSFEVLMPFLRILGDGVASLIIILFLAWTNWLALCLLIVILGSMIWILDRLCKNRMKTYGRLSNDSSKKIFKTVNEAIAGMKEIRVLGKSAYFYDIFYQSVHTFSYNHGRMHLISSVLRIFLEFSVIFFVVLFIFSIQFFNQSTENLIPTLGTFGAASLRILPFFYMLSEKLASIRYSRNSVSLLYEELKNMKSMPTVEKKVFHSKIEPFNDIKLNNLSFSYSCSEDSILKNISIEIYSGESIGLVGTSGSGKTTLIDVLLGLLEADEGNIVYNGKPLVENIHLWHSQVAYLPQEAFLTDDTLRRNVALGFKDTEIDEALVWQSLKKARLGKFVANLPGGLETELGEKGIRLSGGQRQRVALARAFYHKRDVLILDEATSALDYETEKEIIQEIQEFKGLKTMIVIAHRLTTVQHCDRVYRLEDGRIVSVESPR